jgi:hypothetical protein
VAITFRSADSNSGNVTTLTVTKPAGVIDGDIMVAAIGIDGGSGVSITTPPAGWTLARRTDNGTAIGLAVYYKVAASEGASYDWVFDTKAKHSGGICAYYDNDAAPFDQENGQATASSTDHAAPTITPTVSNTMLVASYVIGALQTWTADAAMTERVDESSASTGLMMSDELWVSGATGTRTGVASGAAVGVTHMLSLKPLVSTTQVVWIQDEIA